MKNREQEKRRAKIAYRLRSGKSVAQIMNELDCSKAEVESVQIGMGRTRPYTMKHSYLIQPYTRRPAQTGRCVYFIPQERRVCGAKCKGQRCDNHPQGVMINPVGINRRKGWTAA